ncbi:NAD-dependent epimerase/dehydratase [Hyaloraphidium curvatum]|nr:NAD-dependent epimerase/dehydratase [Hyaloraphidium curvatum]
MDPATPPRAFVSGAGGFLGAHLVAALLSLGYAVRASVRRKSDPKNAFLSELPGAERLQVVEADLSVPGSFDGHVAGCAAVFHVASPFVVDTLKDPQRELVDPAVTGTLAVFEACKKAPGVEVLVVTASLLSIADAPSKDGRAITEADWNTEATLKWDGYNYSKVEAERALREAYDAWTSPPGREKFRLVTIHPSLIWGPSLSPALSVSTRILADLVNGAMPSMDLGIAWVHVEDVVAAHVLAARSPTASGRYLVSGGSHNLARDVAPAAAKLTGKRFMAVPNFAAYLVSFTLPVGKAHFVRTQLGRAYKIDTSRSRELGVPYAKGLGETLAEVVQDFRKWGHFKK